MITPIDRVMRFVQTDTIFCRRWKDRVPAVFTSLPAEGFTPQQTTRTACIISPNEKIDRPKSILTALAQDFFSDYYGFV